jgi:hypothetical protein
MSSVAVAMTPPAPPPAYFSGLLDATLALNFSCTADGAPKSMRVVLVCDDERVTRETHSVSIPTRETIVRRPGKKDNCVALFANGNAKTLLAFAAENCLIKKNLAIAAIAAIEAVDDARPAALLAVKAEWDALMQAPDIDAVLSTEWVTGFFEARGTVNPPKPVVDAAADAPVEVDHHVSDTVDTSVVVSDPPAGADTADTADSKPKSKPKAPRAPKPRRGVVKYVLPKHEKALIPLIQKVIGAGKIKKSSPCRLIFDASEIETFLEVVGRHVRARSADLQMV